jgi:hypothetical protein
VGLAGSLSDGGEVEQLGGEAFSAFLREDFTRARESAEQQWELAEAQGDRFQAGLAAANLAAALAIAGRVDEALEWYETAQNRLRAGDRSRELGRLAVARGVTLYIKGETELGDRELARARERLGADDWRLGFVAALLHIWTRVGLWQGEEVLEELLERARQGGDSSRIAAARARSSISLSAGRSRYRRGASKNRSSMPTTSPTWPWLRSRRVGTPVRCTR